MEGNLVVVDRGTFGGWNYKVVADEFGTVYIRFPDDDMLNLQAQGASLHILDNIGKANAHTVQEKLKSFFNSIPPND